MIVGSFIFFLLMFLTIGLLSTLKAQKSNKDYLLAGSNVAPWLAGLSAVATSNSGFMFVGMIGTTYFYGISSMWLGVGFVLGDYLASIFTHRRVRMITEEQEVLSFGGVLARWHGTHHRRVRFVAGVVTVLFLGTYAAAQFLSGSKALHVLFGWDYNAGAIIGAVMVFAYCMAGGIRASIWTDAAQSIVMFGSMALLCFMGLQHVGGVSALWHQMEQIGPTYTQLFTPEVQVLGVPGIALFLIGWLFGGFGVIGQPHIMVRFMTVDKVENINRVRAYYYAWYSTFYFFTVVTGLIARVVLAKTEGFDSELALPTLAQNLMPDVLIGLVLAGLFAATMSTADSQIISCSAALTRDILPRPPRNIWLTKLATLTVTLIALGIVLLGVKRMFTLSMIGWSVLASAFGPLLFIYSIGKKVSERTALVMMVGGTLAALIWRQVLDWSGIMYDIAPGMITGLVVYGISTLWGKSEGADAGEEREAAAGGN
jgi:SSS family transporter